MSLWGQKSWEYALIRLAKCWCFGAKPSKNAFKPRPSLVSHVAKYKIRAECGSEEKRRFFLRQKIGDNKAYEESGRQQEAAELAGASGLGHSTQLFLLVVVSHFNIAGYFWFKLFHFSVNQAVALVFVVVILVGQLQQVEHHLGQQGAGPAV